MTIVNISIVIVLVAIGGAYLLVKQKRSLEEIQTKILLFGLYFWLFVFVEIIIATTIYYFMTR